MQRTEKPCFIFNERGHFDTPTGVSLFTCDFDLEHYQRSLFHEFGIYLPPSVQTSVAKRQAEFLAGRYAAQRNMQQTKIKPVVIEIGVNRAPTWPQGLIGSITHSRARAISVSKKTCEAGDVKEYLGVDVENFIDQNSVSDLESSIYRHQDRKIVLASGLPPHIALTLIFSAKESLFKATHPFVGEYFGFDKAEVRHIDLDAGLIELWLDNEFAIKHGLGRVYQCRFTLDTSSVFTLICNNVENLRLPW